MTPWFIDLLHRFLVTPGVLQFAVNTYGRRAHPNYPAEFDVIIDTNRDGAPDFVVFNAELGGFAVTGHNVVFVGNLTTQVATAVAFADADLQSGNVILTVPTLAIGITDIRHRSSGGVRQLLHGEQPMRSTR